MSKVLPQASPARPSEPPSVLAGLVRLVRIKQWSKNVLVLAAPAAAGAATHGTALTRALLAFLAFCAVSAGTYCINDVVDMDADRHHPVKRYRPVAAGVVSPRLALVVGIGLLAVGIGGGAALAWRLGLVLVIYLAIQLAYTLYLKGEPVLDLACVAAGFVLRAIAGAVAIPVRVSEWFLIVTTFGSLLMVTGKRLAEGPEFASPSKRGRSTVDVYSATFLRTVLAISAGGAIVGYCLWAFSLQTALAHHHDAIWYQLSIVPFFIALLRYTFLVENGKGARPEELVLGDRPLQLLGVIWGVLFALRGVRQLNRELLTGWGRTSPSSARVTVGHSREDLAAIVQSAGPRGVIARGLGRSYGDAAQNAGGEVIVTTALDRILAVDVTRAEARVEAGVSLDRLMRVLVPLGLWPMVSPGTRQVTVGGAIAADVHGKNHHHDGTFTANVTSLVLETPALGSLSVSPTQQPDVFWATAGGMGLTGVISEATIRLVPIESASMRVDSERTPDLETTMRRLAEADAQHRYSVAWIDCLARGRSLGRSVLEFGDHARLQDLGKEPRARRRARDFQPAAAAPAPPWAPPGLLNHWSIAAFNELWYRKAPRRREGQVVPAAKFFHPLDAVAGWNRLYGNRGFVQYQLVVPDAATDTLGRVVEAVSQARCASFLAVLKRFGAANPAPLSFPQPGWTLALDIPAAAADLAELLDGLDELVVAAGGRVYLAKDGRLRPDLFEAMYPELPRWRAVRERLDPDRRMCSDLARRLPALLESAPAAV